MITRKNKNKERLSKCFDSYIFSTKTRAFDAIRYLRHAHPHLRKFVIIDDIINIDQFPNWLAVVPGHVCESEIMAHPLLHCLFLRSRRSSTLAAMYVYVKH